PHASLPDFPDQVDVIEFADPEHPFRLATSPARNFLNSSFSDTKTSRQKEGRPEVVMRAWMRRSPRLLPMRTRSPWVMP
ncbi:hypothetical protein, partial [Rhizobium leguminosarum]|uniref:hypothetical protein n=1 Tax=Rhizobium leguminosarum TaxID=384 RepID=UPI003F98D372